MFQCLNLLECKQQGLTNLAICELPVKLIIPPCYQGKAVTNSIVMRELIWQQYGLDVIHPKVSRWLEQNAPDIINLAADDQLAGDNDRAQIKVDPNVAFELHLPLKLDDRLREVSTQYFLSQVQYSIEPETEPRLQAA